MSTFGQLPTASFMDKLGKYYWFSLGYHQALGPCVAPESVPDPKCQSFLLTLQEGRGLALILQLPEVSKMR